VPIGVDKNVAYGPPLVNQKYRPLENVQYLAADHATYSAMLPNRLRLLRANGLWPQPLDLIVPNWAAIIAAEAPINPHPRPPLVVVSSNRSQWIADGVAAAATELQGMQGQPAAFTDERDLRALRASVGQAQSPPIYCPTRLGANANRNVYIVVHASEYNQYKTKLAGLGMTVVGWEFKLGQGPRNRPQLTGFGPSRFAAIEFCKHLRARVLAGRQGGPGGNPWDYAWLLDDNVVALTNFSGFQAYDQAIANAPGGPHVAVAFQGGTSAEAHAAIKNWATNEIAHGRGNGVVGPPALPPAAAQGIIQQASLWNLNFLAQNNLNFGLPYVASAEDLSFGYYFDFNAIPYLWYGGGPIRKEDIGAQKHDNGAGAKQLKKARNGIAKLFADAEALDPPVANAPVPLRVQPVNANDGGVQILKTFVVNRVLPNSGMNQQAGDKDVQNNACCQSVELMTCEAMPHGVAVIAAASLTSTFVYVGATAPVINRVNRP
jgi:hypothetical protein